MSLESVSRERKGYLDYPENKADLGLKAPQDHPEQLVSLAWQEERVLKVNQDYLGYQVTVETQDK